MIKHLLLEREEVICIIYAVFSTIISDIHDRILSSSPFFFFSIFTQVFPYLIDADRINSISYIYLHFLKCGFDL